MGRKKRKQTSSSATASTHNLLAELPEVYTNRYAAAIKKAAAKWGISEAQLQESPVYKHEGGKSTRFGNRNIKPATKCNYEAAFKQLWRFCLVVGDYDSLLILMSPAQKNVVSMAVTANFGDGGMVKWSCFHSNSNKQPVIGQFL